MYSNNKKINYVGQSTFLYQLDQIIDFKKMQKSKIYLIRDLSSDINKEIS
jgi:hypothetical protein